MGTTNTTKALRISLKWAWTGLAAGIACMIALFIAGIVTQTPGLTVMAASIAAMLGGAWAGIHTTLQRKLARAEQP
ncbi:hypothetical protein JT358_05995 [Micrococcales bacterium 31B]|nr:hypothetical protein [Micrococcales bacterium 31B]